MSFAYDDALELLLIQTLEELTAAPGPDPYWPKWNNRWWRLALLSEMDQIKRVSPAEIESFADELDQHYLHHFPLKESELPAGTNPYGDILCFCALGTAARILAEAGINPWQRLPWLKGWLSRYQLPDGGYNCDEQAYTGSCKSSLVSTVPVLEALLASQSEFNPEEQDILLKGLNYLLEHRLFQRRQGGVIHQAWLKPLFPRFYEYDILRSLRLVCKLAIALNQPIAQAAIQEALEILRAQTIKGELEPQEWYLAQERTLVPQPEPAEWLRSQPAELFALLEYVIQAQIGRKFIGRQWQELQTDLQKLEVQGLLLK